MPQVLAWECKHTGKLFKEKAKYLSHLRKQAAGRLAERRARKMEEQRAQFLIDMGNEVTSFESLEDFIARNWKWFMNNGHSQRAWRTSSDNTIRHELVKCSFTRMQWGNHVSNTHSAPRGGVTNWDRDPLLPAGYPGWTGRVTMQVRVPNNHDGFGSDYFAKTGVHTGTGGGCGQIDGIRNYSYDVTVFADDFATMKKLKMQALMWDELSTP
jgi:hypothetical protein